jgi:hypothetical protein
VTTGYEEPTRVEISKGLRGDEHVVVVAEGLKDKETVQVLTIPETARVPTLATPSL